MGDLNVRSPVTGDTGSHDRTHKANAKLLDKLLKTLAMTVAKNNNLISNETHWTFHGPQGGVSIPDYILYPVKLQTAFHDYNVTWHNNCGSYHALQTITLATEHHDTSNFWETETTTQTTWNEENISTYKHQLQNHNIISINTIKDLAKQSKLFIEQIQQAKNSFTRINHKRKLNHVHKDTELNKLINQKHELIKTANKYKSNKKANKEHTWKLIRDINNEIHKQAYQTFTNEHEWWWNTLAKIDCNNNANDFWKLIKKIRKPKNDSPFPSAIVYAQKTITTKPEIKKAISSYYLCVAEGTDPEALLFRTAFPQIDTNKETDYLPKEPNSPALTPITMELLKKAIENLSTNKAAGPDGISAECFKNLPENMRFNLLILLQSAANLKITPKKWQNNFVKLIYKK